MRIPFLLALALLPLLLSSTAWGKVVGRDVEYKSGDTVLKGYLVENPEVKGERPAVMVVHEWWGLNEYARKRARMLAEQGYTALAVDMYGEGKTAEHPDDASRFSAELMKNKKLMETRFRAALEFLKQQPSVNTSRIAAVGYCFGGGVVLHLARQAAPLRGVVSFHGPLATDAPARPGMVWAKVLVFNGEADPMVTPQEVEAFKNEMHAAGAPFSYIGYPGVKHGFTNTDSYRNAAKYKLPVAYDSRADRDSWKETLTFLKNVLKR